MIRNLAKKIKLIIEGFVTILLRTLIPLKANKNEYRLTIMENIYNPYLCDANFLKSLSISAPHTIISTYKFQSFYWALQESPPGDALDIGVLRGGSSLFLASQLKGNDKVYSVDNWSEHSKPSSDSTLTYSSSRDLQEYQKAINAYELENKVKIYDSSLSEFLNKYKNEISGSISLIHFDIYSETVFDDNIKDILGVLKKGGVLLIGGYGALSLPKLSKSVNDFAEKNREHARFFQDKCGYGVFLKLV
jgi:hypothetical protein